MPLAKERLLYLLDAWSGNRTTTAEELELFEWVNESSDQTLIFQHIQHLIEQYDEGEKITTVDWDNIYKEILRKGIVPGKHSLLQMRWFRSSAAALIIILFGSGLYFFLNNPAPKNIITTETPLKKVIQDIAAPVKSKAVLTLSDGSKIDLDSVSSGTLARQGGIEVVKLADGQISYNGTGNEMLFNTLNVPRGSKVVTIKLSDGTMVWLNSESSLRYPAAFSGNERNVTISGEAYFEVTHNPSIPFIVKSEGMEIKVLGTHFNINTYKDDRVNNKVTLLEGSVRVSIKDRENLLKPGQQAQVNDDIKLISGVNMEEVMAWKNGLFQFGEKADLSIIMKKIERWYDVTVDYEGASVRQKFGGEIPMNSNLSQVLEILRTSGVKFTIEGRKVIVKP
ncbi:MAG: FecR family protein [Ferruginibacter sp.]